MYQPNNKNRVVISVVNEISGTYFFGSAYTKALAQKIRRRLMDIKNTIVHEAVRGVETAAHGAKTLGKTALRVLDGIMYDAELPEKLQEEAEQQAIETEQDALEYYRADRVGNHQNEVIALILARSICRKLSADPDAAVEDQLMKLKEILAEELPNQTLYTLGLAPHHYSTLSKLL